MFSTAVQSGFAFECLPSTTSQKRTAQRGCGSGEYQAGAGKVRLGACMKLSVIYQPTLPASTSPYRVCNEDGGEIEWANAFLDGQRLRQLSLRSLRIYCYTCSILPAGSHRDISRSLKSRSPRSSTMFVINSNKIPSQ